MEGELYLNQQINISSGILIKYFNFRPKLDLALELVCVLIIKDKINNFKRYLYSSLVINNQITHFKN